MKKLLTLCSILVTVVICAAQTSTITGQIQDPTGQTFNNGTCSIQFVPNPNASGVYLLNGNTFNQQPTCTFDNAGNISATVSRNDQITPSGSKWQFIVSPNATAQSTTINITITSGSLNIASLVNAQVPNIQVVAQSNIPRAYSDSEIYITPNPGQAYWNTTLNLLRFWNGSIWVSAIISGSNASFSSLSITGGITAASASITGVDASSIITTGKINNVVYCDGITNTTLAGALTATGGTVGTIVLVPGYSCTVTSITIPIGVGLVFMPGSSLNIPNATTLIINGLINANVTQNIFSFTGSGLVTLGATATQQLSPMWYGAKCDNSTDDTTAFNTVLNAANLFGGTVNIPSGVTCVIAGQLTMDQMVSVRMTGSIGVGTLNTVASILKFTGTTTPLIKARSSIGLEFDHFIIQYTNAAFAGRVLDFEHVVALDSQMFRVHDMTITGTSTAKSAVCLICADNTDLGVVDQVSFFWALHAVEALNANIFRIQNSSFASGNPGTGDITGDYITDVGNNTTIGLNNNFEMSSNVGAVNCSTCGNNINIFGNTLNDFVAGYNGTAFKTNSNAINVQNNFVGTGPGSTSAFFDGGGAGFSGVFTGNTLGNWGTAWRGFNGPAKAVIIHSNNYGTITTFMNICCPTSGIIQDNLGLTSNLGFFLTDTNSAYLTTDWTCGTGGTVSSCTAAQIIGSGGGVPLTFSFPLENKSYTWECDLVVSQATAVTANQWNILTATNGATNITANYQMATGATTLAAGAVTDQATTTSTFQITPNWTLGATGTKMPVHIWGRIEGAAATGTILSLQLVAPTVGDLVTIFRGSGCRIR